MALKNVHAGAGAVGPAVRPIIGGAVTISLAVLSEDIGNLEAAVRGLYKQLEPVLQPLTPEKDDGKHTESHTVESPISEQLRTLSRHVKCLTEDAQSIMDRLQI